MQLKEKAAAGGRGLIDILGDYVENERKVITTYNKAPT